MGRKSKQDDDQQEIPGVETSVEVVETPFPDASQLSLKGVKPQAIAAVEKEFDRCVELREKKETTDAALKDAKQRLLEVMKENEVPAYGKRKGKDRWVAAIGDEPVVNLKRQRPDRA